MLKLKSLHLSGIGRFVDEQSIDFSTLGSLIQVDGQNNNTGGSSGSGKTTVFNALDYLLGLNDLPNTVLQSRLTKDPISVHGIFDWNGETLEITRSKKGLKLDLEGKIIEGSSKISEEFLDQVLGMPRHLFRKLLHKRQKEGGFFLEFTPKQMYEFLTDCLNLSSLREKVQKVEDKLKELDLKKMNLSNSLTSNLSALKATQDAILAVGLPPVKDIHQSTILELKTKYDVSLATFKDTEKNHKEEIAALELRRPSVSIPAFDMTLWNQYEEARKQLSCQLDAILAAERERQNKVKSLISEKKLEQSKLTYQVYEAEAAKKSAVEIASHVKKIRDAMCPTCEQSWLTETAKTKEEELLKKLLEHKEKISVGALADERSKVLANELSELSTQIGPVTDPKMAEINSQISAMSELILEQKKLNDEFYSYHNNVNKTILDAFSVAQTELRTRHRSELNQVHGQADLDGKAYDIAVQKLKAYEDARIRYENALNGMKVKEKEYGISTVRQSEELKKIEEDILIVEEIKKGIKSFASCMFDDALEAISDTATRIIRCVPNMKCATIQFEGVKETKEGKIKEEVNAVISVDGELGIPIKSLSGGERSAVDLAVDLAVIDFLENKTGSGIDLHIMDEPFSGLDTIGIEMVLEVLKNSNMNKRLIIVDHNDIIKQMVESKLVVVRDGSTSRIVQS